MVPDGPVLYPNLPKAVCTSLGGRFFPIQDTQAAGEYYQALLAGETAPATDPGDLGAEYIRPTTDPCALMKRWKIDHRLASALVTMAGRLEFDIQIISGYRSPEKQRQLARQGRPAADPSVSTHTWCPATGADLAVGVAPVRTVRARLGAEATRAGLRWGGGSPVDSGGIPSDWNHVDLGPRV